MLHAKRRVSETMARIQGGGDQELPLLGDLGQLQSFLILASSPEKWGFRQCLPGDDPFLGRGLGASTRGMHLGLFPVLSALTPKWQTSGV